MAGAQKCRLSARLAESRIELDDVDDGSRDAVRRLADTTRVEGGVAEASAAAGEGDLVDRGDTLKSVMRAAEAPGKGIQVDLHNMTHLAI